MIELFQNTYLLKNCGIFEERKTDFEQKKSAKSMFEYYNKKKCKGGGDTLNRGDLFVSSVSPQSLPPERETLGKQA